MYKGIYIYKATAINEGKIYKLHILLTITSLSSHCQSHSLDTHIYATTIMILSTIEICMSDDTNGFLIVSSIVIMD